MLSRYPAMVRVTFPPRYVDPTLRATVESIPSATATAEGLGIEGTPSTLRAGKLPPNGNVTGAIGSTYQRSSDYEDGVVLYVKTSDNGGNTGWEIVGHSDDRLGPIRHITFGLENSDSTDPMDENWTWYGDAGKLGVILEDCVPVRGAVTTYVHPTADYSADIQFGVWDDDDGRYYWTSIFEDAGPYADFALSEPSQMATFNSFRADTDNIAGVIKIPANSVLRIINLTPEAGAEGILVDLKLRPFEKSNATSPAVDPNP